MKNRNIKVRPHIELKAFQINFGVLVAQTH